MNPLPYCNSTHKHWDCNNLTKEKKCIALVQTGAECSFYCSIFDTAFDDLRIYHERTQPQLFDYKKDYTKEETNEQIDKGEG